MVLDPKTHRNRGGHSSLNCSCPVQPRLVLRITYPFTLSLRIFGNAVICSASMQLTQIATCLSIVLGATTAAALALPDRNEQMVRSVTVPFNGSSAQFSATLSLDFDEPIPAVEARQRVDEITKRGAEAPIEVELGRRLGPDYISCEGSGDWSDSNGKLTLQYICTTKYPLSWSFKISAAVKKIIVSNVSERGLSWWRNGKKMPQNAPHVEGKGYVFHGTMTGANPNSKIQYQDYFSFRHNVGSGGTGSITFAGEVHTLRD
ncbi:hypothetical protein N657DRAFT_161648 [Parathielavia appendiculata]|uniref:Uncharacterized protein n=1 Tax=Parathielavia appendiculata TaxID=2587402 RepID=A0AAN6YZX5_9PEZI|nr:hypothetical protein N657DRAFT_161648 [Parathielavia appendiculata]